MQLTHQFIGELRVKSTESGPQNEGQRKTKNFFLSTGFVVFVRVVYRRTGMTRGVRQAVLVG